MNTDTDLLEEKIISPRACSINSKSGIDAETKEEDLARLPTATLDTVPVATTPEKSVDNRPDTRTSSAGSDTPLSFFANAEKGLRECANDLSDRISVLQKRFEAYIGPIEEAEEHTVDNKFIVRGYRINHNTCGRLVKSLCTCHNEFVNVWSHIGGVLVFLVMITVVCINVLPN